METIDVLKAELADKRKKLNEVYEEISRLTDDLEQIDSRVYRANNPRKTKAKLITLESLIGVATAALIVVSFINPIAIPFAVVSGGTTLVGAYGVIASSKVSKRINQNKEEYLKNNEELKERKRKAISNARETAHNIEMQIETIKYQIKQTKKDVSSIKIHTVSNNLVDEEIANEK